MNMKRVCLSVSVAAALVVNGDAGNELQVRTKEPKLVFHEDNRLSA